MLLISPLLKHLLLTLQKKIPHLKQPVKWTWQIFTWTSRWHSVRKQRLGNHVWIQISQIFFCYSGSHSLVLLCQKFHDAIWHMHVSNCISWVFEGRWFSMSININWKQKYSNCISWEVILSRTKPKHSSLGIFQMCGFQNSQAVSKIAVKKHTSALNIVL